MPRRESYRTDDEDDDYRRASASGGGIPAWVWVIGGGGVLGAIVVVVVGFAFFTSRQAAVRQDVARAETVRMEVEGDRAMMVAKAGRPPGGEEPEPDHLEAPELPVLSLERIANAYRNDPDAADGRYAGKRVRVRFEVSGRGTGWVGATALIVPDRARGAVPNVIFRVAGATAEIGSTVVIEGRCAGLAPDATTGMKLTFTDCRVIRQ